MWNVRFRLHWALGNRQKNSNDETEETVTITEERKVPRHLAGQYFLWGII